MPQSLRLNKRSLVILLFIALAVSYVLLLIYLPLGARASNKYNLTKEQSRNLSLAVAIPYMGVWFTGMYGYLRLDQYAQKIKQSTDGQAFARLAVGLLALALALPISSIVTNLDNLLAHSHPHFIPTATILNNYINLVPMLLAFYFIFLGSRQLYRLLPNFKVKPPDAEFVPTLFVLASTFFAYFTLTNPARHHPAGLARTATFYLPDWLIVLTIVLPYILMLFCGFSSVVYLRMYTKHVPGILYKRALRYIANGTLIAISSLITLRIISSMTAWFESRTLRILLIIVYVLLFVIGTGYALIYQGAKRLNQIEDVSTDNRATLLKKLLNRR